ncbi:2TM domain-containing protein [Aquimarina rhabdastrellae]
MTTYNDNNTKESTAYKRAKKRVDDEKGFYTHLVVYIVINTVLLFVNSDFLDDGLKNWSSWHLFITPFFWGIGLLIHALRVFSKISLFGKDWEERKIKELMDKDSF